MVLQSIPFQSSDDAEGAQDDIDPDWFSENDIDADFTSGILFHICLLTVSTLNVDSLPFDNSVSLFL